jgi:glycosyltransferase involved in cell wall biosynthesis
MKILIIHQYFLEQNGAGGSRFNQFVKYWAEAGHKITIVAGTVDYATGKKEERYKGKWIVRNEIGSNAVVFRCFVSENYNKNFLGRFLAYFSFVISSFWAILFCIGDQDVIIATSPPLFVAIPAYIAKIIRKAPLIFEIRDLWPKFAVDAGVIKNKLIIKFSYGLEYFIYRKADLINVLTPSFKEYLLKEKNISENKIIYIPNGGDLDIMKPGPKDNWVRNKFNWSNKFIVLYVGAHGTANDLWQIINVAKLLKDRRDILFVLIGDGMEKLKLKETTQKEKLDNIQFLDPVPKNAIVDFINASDVCVAILQPIFTTTYPNKIFDYMACAKPIILPIDGVCRRLIIDEAGAGIFAKPGDAPDFKEKILYFYDRPEEAREMGLRGLDFVKNNFDRKKLAQKYLEAIVNLAKKK